MLTRWTQSLSAWHGLQLGTSALPPRRDSQVWRRYMRTESVSDSDDTNGLSLTDAPVAHHCRLPASTRSTEDVNEEDEDVYDRQTLYTALLSIGSLSALALLCAMLHHEDLKSALACAADLTNRIKRNPLKYLSAAKEKSAQKQTRPLSSADVDISDFEECIEDISTLAQRGSRRGDAPTTSQDEVKPDQCYQTFGDESEMMIFSGSANPELAREVCAHLDMTLGRMRISRFNDGEVSLDVLDDVRSRDVYVFQSVPNASTGQSLHSHIMELFLTISALRRASAERITAVLPYMAYSRQGDVDPIHARPLAVADMSTIIHTLGADRVVFVDLHAPRSAAFFPASIPVTNLQPQSLAIKYLVRKGLKSPVVVATENTAAESAKAFWARMKKVHDDVGLATLVSNRPDRLRQAGGVSAPLTPEQFSRESTVPAFPSGHSKTYFVGNVQNRDCVVVDDIIDTGVRVCNAVRACKAAGARRIFVYCTHGVLSQGSVDRLDQCGAEEVIITNTIEVPPNVYSEKIKVLNISKLIAQVLKRLHAETHNEELS